MYLFTRRARISGSIGAAVAHAVSVGKQASEITGLNISVWATVMSPELGGIAWGTMVPDLKTLETAGDKMATSEAYMSAVESGASYFTGVPEDSLSTIVHGAPDPARQAQYLEVTRAVILNGHMAAAMQGSVEIAQFVEKLTGTPTLVAMSVTGAMGEVAWMSGYADITELETQTSAVNGDPGYVEMVDRLAPMFAQGATTTIYRRIG